MTETKNPGEKTLSVTPTKTLTLKRGVEQGVFRDDLDALKVYVSIAALGFFYLSNRWTLSTVFRRDLTSTEEIESWGQHMVDVTLSFLRRR